MGQSSSVSTPSNTGTVTDREVVQIVAIHGTNDTDSKTRGFQWWQKDSPFSDKVMSLLNTTEYRYLWVAQRWSGRNLEADRRRAARALSEDLSQVRDELPSRIVLIGHSHGGNVCDFALRGLPRAILDRLDVLTIGAPILRHSYTFLDATLNALKWLAITILVIAGSLALGNIWSIKPGSAPTNPIGAGGRTQFQPPPLTWDIMERAVKDGWPIYLSVFVVAFCISAPGLGKFLRALPHILYRRAWVSDVLESLAIAPAYRRMRRIVRVYSSLDEAINGLRDLTREPVRLARPQRLWFVTWVVFFFAIFNLTYLTGLMPFCGFYQKHSPEVYASDVRCGVFLPLSTEIQRLYEDLAPRVASFLPEGLHMPALDLQIIYLVLALAISFSFALTATLLPVVPNVTSWFANLFVRGLALGRAYGAAPRFFPRWNAAPNPEYVLRDDDIWRPLPIAFDHQITALADRAAAQTLRAARESMGAASVMKSQSFAASMSGAISWKELVHTTYFDLGLKGGGRCVKCNTWECHCSVRSAPAEPPPQPEFCFAEFIAHVMIERFGLKASNTYDSLAREKKDMYDRYLAHIAPECEAQGYKRRPFWRPVVSMLQGFGQNKQRTSQADGEGSLGEATA